jgi:hypothetical protein
MEKEKMNKKQVKSYTLSEETISAIEAYSKISGNSLSQSTETLILNGLENIASIEKLTNRITQEFKNINTQNKKDLDRLISIIIGQTRSIGKIYGVAVTHAVRSQLINQDDLEEIFNSGIKRTMQEFKNNDNYSGKKDYE